MSRSTSQSSTATTTTTTHGLSRTQSVKTNTKTQSLNSLSASDIRLFVTNLRLLDLDLRSDWPGITVQTFSAKNADQKQRIGGAEWALFRLFEIWDAHDTAQKLQPFFPPLEPLQSLNLRAALYRCLNELKKNGVLGRESVLRKTMLDECKGEKFYELLAIFSAAVLKKVLAERDGNSAMVAVSRKLATAPMLSKREQQSLLPLAIAHKVALTDLLRRKEEKRRRYLEFQRLLDTKSEDINRRIRKCKDTPQAQKPVVSQKEAEALKKQLKDNWIGNQKWLDVMLHGDDVQKEDAFLRSRFDKVWYMVEKGRSLENVVAEAGLLEDLQSRVTEQQDRLQKWKAFHDSLQKEKKADQVTVPKPTAVIKEFVCDDHLKLQLPVSKEKNGNGVIQRPALRAEYQDILTEMDEELLRISKNRPSQQSAPLSRRRRSSSNNLRSPARSRKNTRSESISKGTTSPVRTSKPQPQSRKNSLDQVPALPRPRYVPPVATPLDSDATLVGHTSTLRSALPVSHSEESLVEAPIALKPAPEPTPPTSDPIVESSPSPFQHDDTVLPDHDSPTTEPMSEYPSEPPVPFFEPPSLTSEEALAEQIISSIGNATPSPVKKPQPRMSLSLMERTRMSMARTTSFEPVPESPDLPLPQLPEPPTAEPETDRNASLLERTRLSMVAMQSKPRASLAPRERRDKRKSRQSLFPINQFDTPRNRKSFELLEETKGSRHTPKEELFSDEVDYDRVFKSRPRIATSPVFSPQGGAEQDDDGDEEYEDGVTGIDLADVDVDDEEGFTGAWADSPSRRGRG
ncbi:hypothetical protein IQ07DRAFT_682197 [Pyrenochaeta sp. DS3sAY3a]|nr:hypothetical protein IQ07DRAFT_682197 [Pyrenochaeta sp. DS3sAY3a]